MRLHRGVPSVLVAGLELSPAYSLALVAWTRSGLSAAYAVFALALFGAVAVAGRAMTTGESQS